MHYPLQNFILIKLNMIYCVLLAVLDTSNVVITVVRSALKGAEGQSRSKLRPLAGRTLFV